MQILELKKEEREKAEGWLKYYKHVCLCKKCNYMYGFDLDSDKGLCHNCTEEKSKETKKKNLKAKRK